MSLENLGNTVLDLLEGTFLLLDVFLSWSILLGVFLLLSWSLFSWLVLLSLLVSRFFLWSFLGLLG